MAERRACPLSCPKAANASRVCCHRWSRRPALPFASPPSPCSRSTIMWRGTNIRFRFRRFDPRRRARLRRRLAGSGRQPFRRQRRRCVAAAAGPHRRARGAGLGSAVATGDPCLRRRPGRSRHQGASMVGADVAWHGAGRRAHADRPCRPAAVAPAQAGARTLLHRWPVRAAARRGMRAARRRALSGLRDRRADRLGGRGDSALLSLPPHRGTARRFANPLGIFVTSINWSKELG